MSDPANLLKARDSWYLRPVQGCGTGRYRVFLLEKSSDNTEGKAVTLIPYVHPAQDNISPHFYKVISEEELDLSRFSSPGPSPISLSARTTSADYIQKLRTLKQHIQRGDIYEINFCIEFYAENVKMNPLQVFMRLYDISKAPYASLLKVGCEYIISASPELFLEKKGRRLLSKPIKGTIRRGKTEKEDKELAEILQTSEKERTENVMAVDVARNDLSRLAKRGTVSVNKLCNIETYETVHQMVSTVSCELREDVSFNEIMGATFPMASMTGAPKLSAMNLISKYENFSRNYYSGAMGIVEENGDFELSVNIRCIFYDELSGRLSIAVGSAITHLCEPEKEYEECLLKAEALMKAMNAKLSECV